MQNEKCKMKSVNYRSRIVSPSEASSHDSGCRSNLQLSICNFHFSIPLLFALCALLFVLCPSANSQVIADKAVASVTNGSRATPDLITYSDLIWQLALEPATSFAAKPSSENLNRTLRLLEDQVLVLQEARK